jgi:hypothetical protein
MTRLPLSFRELLVVMGSCAVLVPRTCDPASLRDFVAGWLEESDPGLSGKVRRLDDKQMDAVGDLIVRAHDLTHSGGADGRRGG